jgi:hypothetical protein
MKKNIKILLILFLLLITADKVSAKAPFTGGIDPHDSLIYDGTNPTTFRSAPLDANCYIKVLNITGTAKGTVIKQTFMSGCTKEIETTYVAEYKTIEKNDILDNSTEVETGSDGKVEIGINIAGYSKESSVSFMTIYPSSKITLPMIQNLCFFMNRNEAPAPYEKIERIKVVKGIVTYKTKPGTKPMLETQGKNSSAKHTKTNYSHEVKIEGNDTIDVIRVYEGSVEVTYIKTDASDETDISNKIEKLSQDMQDGKLTMEELQAKMNEFQTYGQNLSELMKPVTVDEGNKCTITKTSRIVEPLGPGDAEN